jgi:hypothetical protein
MGEVLEIDPFANGHWVLAFDGRVLEIFGPILVGGGVNWTTAADSWRIHVKHLSVKPTGPDKHGLRGLAFGSLVNQHTKNGGIANFYNLDEAQWNRFQPLLEALAKAAEPDAPGSASAELLATKGSAFQALLNQYDLHLSSQPDGVRNAVVGDLQSAGVPIDPVSFAVKVTAPTQIDAWLEVYKRHGLLPPDASIG